MTTPSKSDSTQTKLVWWIMTIVGIAISVFLSSFVSNALTGPTAAVNALRIELRDSMNAIANQSVARDDKIQNQIDDVKTAQTVAQIERIGFSRDMSAVNAKLDEIVDIVRNDP